ncbi:iron-sulfur cluster assembly scaffold protein [Fusibacter sp. 3D3]|uniref:iron-sulfur cluster assembly scaffold protein n=1 Tax=Fusibacter sp. 3D3 TaxID=1048380 RepID=UPI0008530F37|nr:iron-sulfur cluster assembly scaffold protein [Fusibacter sp. 3D3]GAU75694.1 iron-sulfur cluster assembly scaffold protein IscU/NifU-like [Fusibacter sp. 3D3]
MYSEKVLDHFMNPRNVGMIQDPDGEGSAGDPECGDYLEITIQVEHSIIVDIKFMVHGCAGAIATSSVLTELAKGKHILVAYTINENDIVTALDHLPKEKIHCSLLGTVALRNAINDYRCKCNK